MPPCLGSSLLNIQIWWFSGLILCPVVEYCRFPVQVCVLSAVIKETHSGAEHSNSSRGIIARLKEFMAETWGTEILQIQAFVTLWAIDFSWGRAE